MKKILSFKPALFLMAVVFLMSGCASSTMISSNPSGAKVFINGESVGTTPYLYTDTKIIGNLINLDLVKEGYEPIYTSFRRAEEANVGAIVGGFFVWPLWLWSADYKPTHNYELVPIAVFKQSDEVIPAQAPEVQAANSKLDKLKELKKMFDEKLITEQEYNKQKQKVLDEK